MATALPQTAANFATLNMRSEDNLLSSQSLSKRWYTRAVGGQAWAFTARWQMLTNAEARAVMGVVAGLRGPLNELTMIPPVLKDGVGIYSGTPLVNGGSQTGSSLILDGASTTITDWAKAGDYFNIAGEEKVYQITADASSDGAGNVTLSIYPPLVSSPANNSAVTFSDVTFNMRMVNQYQARGVQPNHFVIELDMVESF